jgi:starch synthase (maltosyl-transferring)
LTIEPHAPPPLSSAEKPLFKGPSRVAIENVEPEVDGGRFPIKRTVGEVVRVEADVFAEGHDVVSAVCLYRHAEQAGAERTAGGDSLPIGEWASWSQALPLAPPDNDRWEFQFAVTQSGRYEYTVAGWVDHFQGWRRDFAKKVKAGVDVWLGLLVGADLIAEAAARAEASGAPEDGAWLDSLSKSLRVTPNADLDEPVRLALSDQTASFANKYPDRAYAVRHRVLAVTVDGPRSRFSAWYEMFPRSIWRESAQHATFKDVEGRLDYLEELGFDVLYFPPIHPIGRTHRKGKNNSPTAQPGEAGSPWAIGAEEGGHKSVHPRLGSLEDFRHLVKKAREQHGIEIALDIAYQCTPDHPYVKEHPEWFRRLPDGAIQYAENPPKKYQDIYPFDFETGHWRELWQELKSVLDFWMEQGVRVFRIDNPHTKPFAFWEWLISDVKRRDPEVIFLSEAFTRPKVMYRLAKLGFTHSYTYFAWRNTKRELTEYFTELTETSVREFFRPHLWPNTPDILTEFMQLGGRPSFIARLVLAATLSANFGIYGPAYELFEHRPLVPGKEEYLDAEKYEIKHWDVDRSDSLRTIIRHVNRIRRDNPALQRDSGLQFCPVDNDQLIAYTKTTDDLSNVILVVVSLDANYTQSGFLTLAPEELGVDPRQPYEVHDLLTDNRYRWSGPRNYVELHPSGIPAHIFHVRSRVHTERDFDNFRSV